MWSFLFGPTTHHSPAFEISKRLFSPDDLKHLQTKFHAAAKQEGHARRCDIVELFSLQDLNPFLATQLFQAIAPQDATSATFDDVLIAVAKCRKGTEGESDAFLFSVLAGSGERPSISEDSLHQSISAVLSWTFRAVETFPLGALANSICEGALQETGDDRSGLSEASFRKWCRVQPAIYQALRSMLSLQEADRVMRSPKLLLPEKAKSSARLLSPERAWLLAALLPQQQSLEWELLFASGVNGKSFNTFMGCVGGKGPTLLLVKDKGGAVFGGYAADPWERRGSFYGAFGCLLFRLHPWVGVWKGSGANQHFQYCGHNFAAIPNGVGFGGQVDYFSVFVDGSFEKGMSRPGATFRNPCLACEEVFEVDTVECWLVERPEEEDLPTGPTGSVLDRFKEDRNMLELAGRGGSSSRGIREAPPGDEM